MPVNFGLSEFPCKLKHKFSLLLYVNMIILKVVNNILEDEKVDKKFFRFRGFIKNKP